MYGGKGVVTSEEGLVMPGRSTAAWSVFATDSVYLLGLWKPGSARCEVKENGMLPGDLNLTGHPCLFKGPGNLGIKLSSFIS